MSNPLPTTYFKIILVSSFFVLAFILTAQTAHGQFAVSGGVGGAQLEIDPVYPGPNEKITVRFSDYSSGVQESAIRWFVGNRHMTALDGQTVITLTTPSLGNSMTVEGRTVAQSTKTVSARAVIIPGEIDIVSESDTLVPYFYKGRRMPSVGSYAHIVAIPHLFTQSGERRLVKDLVFTWSLDNQVVKRARGDEAFSLTLSSFGEGMATLLIESADQSMRFEKNFSIPTATPELYFYQQSPLVGLSRNSLRDNYLLGKEQVTVRAEPYFMDPRVYGNAQYGWSIDQVAVSNSSQDPQMITLQKNGEGTLSEIGFSLRNLQALSQSVASLFSLEFE